MVGFVCMLGLGSEEVTDSQLDQTAATRFLTLRGK